MVYRTFAVRARGSNHIVWNTVCQDSVKCRQDDGYSICAVADGHGAAPYFRSHKGSKYAVNCVIKCLRREFRRLGALKAKSASDYNRFLLDINDREKCGELIKGVFSRIHSEWLKCVYNDIDRHPFDWSEYTGLTQELIDVFEGGDMELRKIAYGTTVAAAAVCGDFWLAFQLGDGDCVSIWEDGSITRDVPPEAENFGPNFTYSMCSYDAVDRVRFFVGTGSMPAAVFVSTDGAVNSFAGRRELDEFFSRTARELSGGDMNGNIKRLRKRLYRISSEGCGDDISLAGVMK